MIRKIIFPAVALLFNIALTYAQAPEKTDSIPSDLFYAQESFSADKLLHLSDEHKVIIDVDKANRYTLYLLNEKNIVTDRLKTKGSFEFAPLNSTAFATYHLGGGELYAVENGKLKLKKQTDKAIYVIFLDTLSASLKAFCRDIPVKLLKETDFYMADLNTSERIKTFFSAKDYKLQYDYSKKEYAIPNYANITALSENSIRQFLGGYNAFYHLSTKDLSATLFCLPKVKGGWGYVHDRLLNRDFFMKKSKEKGYDIFMLNSEEAELQYVNTTMHYPFQIYGNRYFYRRTLEITKNKGRKKKKVKTVRSWHKRKLYTADEKQPPIPVKINCEPEKIKADPNR